MKIPDFCIERWVAYAVAWVLIIAATFDDDVSGSERLWAFVGIGAVTSLAEAIASAVTRHGRSRNLAGGIVVDAAASGPGSVPAGRDPLR